MSSINLIPKVIAEEILNKVGGKENVYRLAYCITRLRLTIYDENKVNMIEIKKTHGVMGVVNQNGQLQVILGSSIVGKVTNEFEIITGLKAQKIDKTKIMNDKIRIKKFITLKLLLKKVSNILYH